MSHRFLCTSWKDIASHPLWDEKEMDYLVYQREECPKTKKQHWQIYVEMKDKSKITRVKDIMKDPTMHVETCKGSTQQCIEYCTKKDTAVEENAWEYGKPRPVQGTRTDLEADKKILDETKDITQVSFGNFCRYNKAFDKYLMLKIKPRDFKTEVKVYWGDTKMNKSKTAFDIVGTKGYWKDHTKWWDGYLGQDDVVMDDFHPRYWDEHYLRNLWDRYPFRIEFKGGSCQFNSKRIIVTTNEDPNEWSPELRRRIEIIKMS